MEKLLTEKVVVITGGSSGIGRACALALAAEGAKVAVGARREAEGQETVRLLEQQGGEAFFAQTDVSNADQMKRLVDATVARWGRLDCAVNNAGIEGSPFVATADYDEQVWDQVIDVNLKGVFLAMKYEIPHMVKQKGGSIVNISSIAGLIGGVGGPGYHGSKHGVVGLTRTAAIEYARAGVRVNAVCPAVIETAMADRFFGGRGLNLADVHPLGRTGRPEEVADAVVWLCSERSSFVTGIALPVDGGFTAK
ncbi:MAG TPA: glucose 1-dehydrogenase [Bryobacteraceae bacterium]|jgi:NAD(P)-dependent dehydrogenase (short-subunit alcohol dehydrogenase family)